MTVQVIDPEPLDDFGKLWGALRDITNHSPLSRAEKSGVLLLVLNELQWDLLNEVQAILDRPESPKVHELAPHE